MRSSSIAGERCSGSYCRRPAIDHGRRCSILGQYPSDRHRIVANGSNAVPIPRRPEARTLHQDRCRSSNPGWPKAAADDDTVLRRPGRIDREARHRTPLLAQAYRVRRIGITAEPDRRDFLGASPPRPDSMRSGGGTSAPAHGGPDFRSKLFEAATTVTISSRNRTNPVSTTAMVTLLPSPMIMSPCWFSWHPYCIRHWSSRLPLP